MNKTVIAMKTNNFKAIFRRIFLGIILFASSVSAVNADPRGTDIFSINTPKPSLPHPISTSKPPISPDPLSMMSDRTPVVIWFEQLDNLKEKYKPSEADKVILTRPLMQEAERVKQWTNVASKVSRNYMALARALRNLAVPPGMNDVKEYRDLTADWYQDTAGIYKELIKPRPPAKTIEDLQDSLNAVKKKSEGLAANIPNLRSMDRTLRKNHNVHLAIQEDALQQYVRSK
jgi:hypothetical protein